MARRTIRARRASPYQLYLLIFFIVTTVAFAVLSALAWSKVSQHNIDTFGQAWIDRAEEAGENPWDVYFRRYGDEGTNVVDALQKNLQQTEEYESEIHRLTERLVGDPYDTQKGDNLRQSVSDTLVITNDQMVEAAQTLAQSYQVVPQEAEPVEVTSMQSAVQACMQRIDSLVAQVKQKERNIADLESQLQARANELAAAKQEHARQVTQLEQDLQDEKKRLETARESAIGQSTQFKEQMQRIMDRLIQERREYKAEKEKLERRIMTLREEMNQLQEVIARFRTVPSGTDVDGRIVEVAEMGSVAYADIGQKDGVLLGMTFSIFSPSELGQTAPEPKAEARVVRIMDDASELRIYLRSGDPVVSGDVLHNPIYDRQRRLRFMLVGKMDWDGDGVDDSERIKAMIQEFGGRIETSLTVQTDYLVVGEEPQVGPAPGPDVGVMGERIYEQKRQAFIEYTEAKAKAQDFSIPILSMNRFLGLVGIAGRL
jgi:hypothetical protein